jgi:hypothetical protein
LTQAKTYVGILTTDTTRDATLQEIIDEACDAVLYYCRNGNLVQTQYTQVLDLPSYTSLVLPFTPVTYAPLAVAPIDLQLYINVDANSDPSKFTSANLMTPYVDYCLDMGAVDPTVSDSGIVRLINGVFGVQRERPLYSLSTKIVPMRGAVKAVYTAGYATVPPSLRGALQLIVRKIYNMRKDGVPAVSESLNSYSISRQQNATANGIIQGDPTIRDMLKPFCRPQIGSYA